MMKAITQHQPKKRRQEYKQLNLLETADV
jgi:hypothetical protein